MNPPAPRILLDECLSGAGNCAASDGLRRRAFSFSGSGAYPQASQNRGRWSPVNAPILPVETHPASFVASGLFRER